MIYLNSSNPQNQFTRWVKAQKPVHWASYAIFGVMVIVRALTGGLFILPVYFLAAYALVIVNQYRRKTPKQVRVVALVAIVTAFAWASMTSFAPAHALFFNKLFDLLTQAIGAFGVPGLENVPNWITQGFKILAFIAVAGIIIKLLRSRQGDEEEDGKSFAKVIKFVIILALGDVLLSLIGI